MGELPYDINSKESIVNYAKNLEGYSLREKCGNLELNKKGNKGGFGQLLEKHYFLYEPNSNANADFDTVNLELKSSPLKELKSHQHVSKEKLVLNIINYFDIVNQTFETSSFMKKNTNLLLVFYFYEKEKDILDYKIEIVGEWNFPSIDLITIKKDWETIFKKVNSGKAHELSEGDTIYLSAATKGSKGGSLREQPYSKVKAPQRAYSLKQGYVNHIISLLSGINNKYGRVITSLNEIKNKSLEEVIVSKFEKYYKKTDEEILAVLNINLNKKSKNYYANITKAILGIELDNEIEEFKKADIIVKTVRLKENSLPKEDISFPTFRFQEIVNEEWEESNLLKTIESKFLFIFYQIGKDGLYLEKVIFWNMNNRDILDVKKVWEETKNIVTKGEIVNSIKTNKSGKERRVTNFPNKKFSRVAHVRPHAINKNDTYPLPAVEKLTNKEEYTKHCFWLNSQYVRDEIYLKS